MPSGIVSDIDRLLTLHHDALYKIRPPMSDDANAIDIWQGILNHPQEVLLRCGVMQAAAAVALKVNPEEFLAHRSAFPLVDLSFEIGMVLGLENDTVIACIHEWNRSPHEVRVRLIEALR